MLVYQEVVQDLFFRFWYMIEWLVIREIKRRNRCKTSLDISLDVLRAKETTVHLTLSEVIERFSRNQQLLADFCLAPSLNRMWHKQK